MADPIIIDSEGEKRLGKKASRHHRIRLIANVVLAGYSAICILLIMMRAPEAQWERFGWLKALVVYAIGSVALILAFIAPASIIGLGITRAFKGKQVTRTAYIRAASIGSIVGLSILSILVSLAVLARMYGEQ